MEEMKGMKTESNALIDNQKQALNEQKIKIMQLIQAIKEKNEELDSLKK